MRKYFVMGLIIAGPVLATAQESLQVGSTDYRGLTLLLHEEIEGGFFNQWRGASIYKIEIHSQLSSQVPVFLAGEGKTVAFEGVISFNCEPSGGHYWIGGNYGYQLLAEEGAFDQIVPSSVISAAREAFCLK